MDIVERLRFDEVLCELQLSKGVAGNIKEAAAEIEALREALLPFADAAKWFEATQNYLDTDPVIYKEKFGLGEMRISVGDLRRAKRAIEQNMGNEK